MFANLGSTGLCALLQATGQSEASDATREGLFSSMHQLDALGYMLRYLENLTGGNLRGGNIVKNLCGNEGAKNSVLDLDGQIDALYKKIDREGLDCVFSSYFTTTGRFLDLPRKCELKAVINRMRKIDFFPEKLPGKVERL